MLLATLSLSGAEGDQEHLSFVRLRCLRSFVVNLFVISLPAL